MEGKRSFIAELIRELAAQQNPDKEFSFPQLNFLNPEKEGEESEEEEEAAAVPVAQVVGSSVVSSDASPHFTTSPPPHLPHPLGAAGGRRHLHPREAPRHPRQAAEQSAPPLAPIITHLTSRTSHLAPCTSQVTPCSQVLIQKTGTFNPTQLAALTAVPPGVTVTPARTLGNTNTNTNGP